MIDDLVLSYVRDDASNSEKGRDEIIREMTEIVARLRSVGEERSIAKARAYRPSIDAVLPQESYRQVRYQIARALM